MRKFCILIHLFIFVIVNSFASSGDTIHTLVSDPILFQAQNYGLGTTYFWDFGANATPMTSTDIQPIAVWDVAGTYQVVLETNDGLIIRYDTTCVIVQYFTPSPTIYYDTICAGSGYTAVLNQHDYGPQSIQWFIGPTTWVCYDPFGWPKYPFEVQPEESRTYQLDYITPQGTTGSIFYEISVGEVPYINAGEDNFACYGDSVTLGGTSSYPTAPPNTTFFWSPTVGMDDPTSPSPRVEIVQSITYTLTIFGEFGCAKQDQILVERLPSPPVDPGPNQQITTGETVQLGGANNPFATFQWMPTTGVADPNSSNTTATPDTTTTYELCATRFGCTSCDQVTITVNPPLDLQLNVWLEGPYDPVADKMTTFLNLKQGSGGHRGILPGQIPVGASASITPAGQPYGQEPYNYYGLEGAGWTNLDYDLLETKYSADIVDWILVTLRTGLHPTDNLIRKAGLLLEDSRIVFPNPEELVVDSTITSAYVMIQHRNHMIILSPSPVPIVNNQLVWDFRQQDAYNANMTGFGAKLFSNGQYAMFTGEMDPGTEGNGSGDITGTDLIQFSMFNGIHDEYLRSDLNMDGDINSIDKLLWSQNTGMSSPVNR